MSERLYHEIQCPSLTRSGPCTCQPVIVADGPTTKGATMTVRAKFRVEAIEGHRILMTTVYEPDASKDTENARFTTATPWGRVELGIDNPAALERFKVGGYYYADFTDAPA